MGPPGCAGDQGVFGEPVSGQLDLYQFIDIVLAFMKLFIFRFLDLSLQNQEEIFHNNYC